MTLLKNEQHKGIELYFDSKPEAATIQALKDNGFRWHNVKKCWFAKETTERAELVKSLNNGTPITETAKEAQQTKTVKYSTDLADYISREDYKNGLQEEFEKRAKRNNWGSGVFNELTEFDKTSIYHDIEYCLNFYDKTEDHYKGLTSIREAIVWKSIKLNKEDFHRNGDSIDYKLIWDKLPTVKGLKASGVLYSAMWGYDQTQITTAEYYGKAFGLDVLLTGGYCGRSEVLLKRINKEGEFKESCMYFSKNEYSKEFIAETNTYASYYGR